MSSPHPGTLILTGATGFVGRRLLQLAHDAGWRIRALVRDPDRLDRQDFDPSRLEVETLDLAAGSVPPSLLAGADALVHAAAFIPPDYEDARFARTCFELNTLATIGMLEAAKAAGVPRVVALSSGNAYRPAPGARKEDDALFPNHRAGYYLASKAAGDMLADYYRHAKGLGTVTLRIASVYGYGMPEKSFLPICLANLSSGQPIELVQGGEPTADWVHVDDVALACLRAALSTATGPFNIGSGRATSLREAAELIADHLGADRSLIRLKPIDPGVSATRGFRALDVEKARLGLGYAPMAIQEGIEAWLDVERVQAARLTPRSA